MTVFRKVRLAIGVGFLPLLWCPASLTAQIFPHLETETLSKTPLTLPDAAKGKFTLLIAGFSQASQKNTTPWHDHLQKDFAQESRVAIYDIANLQSVPSFIRSVVVGGMRKSIAEARFSHFLIAFHDEQTWKRTMGFDKADDAYLVLLNPKGEIAWRDHGTFNAAAYDAAHAKVQSLIQ